MPSSALTKRLNAYINDSSFKIRPSGTNQNLYAGLLGRLPSKIYCLPLRTIKSTDINGVKAITVLNVSNDNILRSGCAHLSYIY